MNIKNRKLAFSLIELSIVVLIIGILIAGVTQGSRLVRQSALKVAENLTRSSEVNSIPDLAIWLEPTLNNSIVSATNGNEPEDGDLISSWNDINSQATSLIPVSQPTSALQPQYIASGGINNLPSVKFTSASSTRLYSNTAPLIAGASNYTLIAVWKINEIGVNPYLIFSQGPISSSGSRGAGIVIQNNAIHGFGGISNNYYPYTVTTNQPYITSIVVNNNLSNNVSVYLNSNTPIIGATSSPSTLNLSDQRFVVGAVSYSIYYFDGLISEIIIFNRALKKAEVIAVNQYLSKKYAITLN